MQNLRSRLIVTQLALAAVCGAVRAEGAARWISVATSHFEMYTDNGEKEAERSLQGFGQVRYFFLQNSSDKQVGERRVRIIAFSSEKEFKAFRPNAGTFAFYQQSRERDYIVMQDIRPEHHEAAVHEYTHLIIRHLKLELPLWLEEGLAEVYSSLEPKGAQAMVGRPIANDIYLLSNRPLMDWNVLFRVKHDSPEYNQTEKMQVFYAQSWALTHMLTLGKNYSQGFTAFMKSVNSGMPTSEALQTVYGKSAEAVGKDVEAYLRQATLRAALFDVKLSKSELDPEVADLPPFESELALADLLSARWDTSAEAQEKMAALEKQNPDSPELQESLGYLAWQKGNTDEARKHFGLAVEHGSKNAAMILQDAQLVRAAGGPSSEVIKLFERSLELQPDNLEALLSLAEMQVNNRSFGLALATLTTIHRVTPDQAFRFFWLSAVVRTNLKDYKYGKDEALNALKRATSLNQRTEVTNLIDFIDARVNAPAESPAVVRASAAGMIDPGSAAAIEENRPVLTRAPHLPSVQGKTKSFECLPGGAYRLHLQAGDKEMIFAMPDPKNIRIRNTPTGTIEWNCGPLKPEPVTAVYKPDDAGKAAGVITELIF